MGLSISLALVLTAGLITCEEKDKFRTCSYVVYQGGVVVDYVDKFERECKSHYNQGIYFKEYDNTKPLFWWQTAEEENDKK